MLIPKMLVKDVKSFEAPEEMFALLKILALSNQEIEQGKFHDVEDVFADFDQGLITR